MSTFAIPGSEKFESVFKPTDELQIDPSLKIYEPPSGAEIGPVNFAVLSSKLAQVNDEMGSTIRKMSGSLIVTEAYDFNTAVGDARGELVALGSYINVHGGLVQRMIQWILEHRSANPGIRDGDAFLVNDPWVGAAHQNDTALLRPIFVDGELLAWVGATLHFVDVGGRYPSSFVIDADDVFSESLPMPPIKYVDGGEVRADVEDMFLRRSRMPLSAGLDLRALLGGTNVAARRIADLAEEYGSDQVALSMQRTLDSTEARLRERLRQLPDGVWRHLHFAECAKDGDRGLYKLPMTMEKQHDELTFDLTEADPQTGFFNCAQPLSEASIIAAVLPLLCHDMPWSVGAVARVLNFRFTPGTIIASRFPAASGGGVTQTSWTNINSATLLISKMLAAGPPEHKRHLLAVSNSSWLAQVTGGLDRSGNPTLALSVDQAAGGIGARSWADGDDAAGMPLSPACQIANVESQEWYQPLLWMYRTVVPDSGGPGRYRGGTGARSAVVPYGTPEPMFALCFGSGLATPNGAGLCGGGPAQTGYYKVVRDSDVWERYAKSEIPIDEDELHGTTEWPAAKSAMLPIGLDDVYTLAWFGGGGYGDPLERSLDAVENDITEGLVSVKHARDAYGVVVRDGIVDERESIRLRERVRGERLGRDPMPEPSPPTLPEGNRWLDENLVVGPTGATACGRCGEHLAEQGANYKLGTAMIETALAESDRVLRDPTVYVDETNLVIREFVCKGCGGRVEMEVALSGTPPLLDKQLSQ